jgi:hypothetical protein
LSFSGIQGGSTQNAATTYITVQYDHILVA